MAASDSNCRVVEPGTGLLSVCALTERVIFSPYRTTKTLTQALQMLSRNKYFDKLEVCVCVCVYATTDRNHSWNGRATADYTKAAVRGK